MCELLGISSRRPTRLTISLEALAAHSGIGWSTRDGWGCAFYQGRDVALYREPGAASDSPMVRLLATQGPLATLSIAHIRHATHGEVNLANTQPLVRELEGRTHLFAHNGHLPGIFQSRSFMLDRFKPVGETDSEHAFCALMDRMRALWHPALPAPTIEQRYAQVSAFAAELREFGPANFLYSDGETLFAHGHRRIQRASGKVEPPGLHILSRRCGQDSEGFKAEGLSVASGYQEVCLIASVPLSDEAWRPLGEGEVVAVAGGVLLTGPGQYLAMR